MAGEELIADILKFMQNSDSRIKNCIIKSNIFELGALFHVLKCC